MIFVDAQDDRRGDEERARQADRDRRLQARASTLVLRALNKPLAALLRGADYVVVRALTHHLHKFSLIACLFATTPQAS